MISRSTDIHAALKSRQRGFFTMPGGMGAARPGGGGGGGYGLSATIMSLGPEMYHKLSETGTLIDSSGHGYTVTDVPTIVKGSTPIVSGSAGSILGSTLGAGISVPRMFDATYSGPWSCLLIFHKASAPAIPNGNFWSMGNDDWNVAHEILPTGAVKTTTVVAASAWAAQSAAGVYIWNTPGMYGVTYTPGTGHTVYINGVAVASAAYAVTGLRVSPQGPFIGRFTSSYLAAPGFSYSDHAWFKSALSAGDHAALYAARNT